MFSIFYQPIQGILPFKRFKNQNPTIYQKFVNTFTSSTELIEGCKSEQECVDRATKYYNRKTRSEVEEFNKGSSKINLDQEDMMKHQNKKNSLRSWFQKEENPSLKKPKLTPNQNQIVEEEKIVLPPIRRPGSTISGLSSKEYDIRKLLDFFVTVKIADQYEAIVSILMLNASILEEILAQHALYTACHSEYLALLKVNRKDVSKERKILDEQKEKLYMKLQEFVGINQEHESILLSLSDYLNERTMVEKIRREFDKVKGEVVLLLASVSSALSNYNKVIKHRVSGLNSQQNTPAGPTPDTIFVECRNIDLPLELSMEAINIASLENGLHPPFTYEGMIDIYKLFLERTVNYFLLEDFKIFAVKTSLKDWNLAKKMKETLIDYFPVMVVTASEHCFVIPLHNKDDELYETLIELLSITKKNEPQNASDHFKRLDLIFGEKQKTGRKNLYERFPAILKLMKERLESEESAAHGRRRESTSYIHGVSLQDLKSHIESNMLSQFNIAINANALTYRRYLLPPHLLRKCSINYKKLIDAKIYNATNDLTVDTEEQHWARAQIKYAYELFALDKEKSVIISLDDKAKVDVGKLAVSKHIKAFKLFHRDQKPQNPDHDFPLGEKYKIIPSAYLFMEPNSNRVCIEGKVEFEKPLHKHLCLFNRPFRYFSTTAATHHQDLVSLLEPQKDNLANLMITSDNGVDVSPHSWLVIYYMGSLWKNIGLDNLIICSNAPGCSKYNEVESHFGDLTKRLGQVILVPEASRYFSGENHRASPEMVRNHMVQALDELEKHWQECQVFGRKIEIHNIPPPVSNEENVSEYEELKDFLKINSKAKINLKDYKKIREDFQFFNRHLTRRKYFLHFQKCDVCEYCKNKPRFSDIKKEILRPFGDSIPYPLLLDDDPHHFPKFYDLVDNIEVQEDYLKKLSEKRGDICSQRGCKWQFLSQADKRKHMLIMHNQLQV